MFVYCIFLVGYKGHGNAQNDAIKPQKWMHTVSQGRDYTRCSETHTHCSEDQIHCSENPHNQMTS